MSNYDHHGPRVVKNEERIRSFYMETGKILLKEYNGYS
jgi:hypothetical protein